MNVLPRALKKALRVYITLNHRYYAAAYYVEVLLEWVEKSKQMVCLITKATGNPFCRGANNDLAKKTLTCLPMQFFEYLKTAKELI